MTEAITTTKNPQTATPLAKPEGAGCETDAAITNMLTKGLATDRRALVAYSSWLHHERAYLCRELYPHLGWKAADFIVGDNAGFDFHRKGAPPPSMRAEAVLSLIGCDWSKDSYLGVGDGGDPAPQAIDFPHADARLMDLEREFLDARATLAEIDKRQDDALDEYERREKAFDEADEPLVMYRVNQRGGDGRVFWQGRDLRQILSGRFAPGNDRCAEAADSLPRSEVERLLPLAEARDARREAVSTELDLDGLQAEWDVAHRAADQAAERVYRRRAQSMAGLAIKVRVLKISEPDLWNRPNIGAQVPASWPELALTEIADGVEHLLGTGQTAPSTSSAHIECHMMVGGVHDDDGTVHFCDANGKVLHKSTESWIEFTALRLFMRARTELARRLGDPSLDEEPRKALELKLRRDLRLDALHLLAFQSGDAFDVARAVEAGETDCAVPLPPPLRGAPVSRAVTQAVQEHREAAQLMLLDPQDGDNRTEAHVCRIDALMKAVCEAPVLSVADLRYKAIYLGTHIGKASLDREVVDVIRCFEVDACRLAEQLEADEATEHGVTAQTEA